MLPDPESFRSVVSGVPVGGNGDGFRRGRRWVGGWWVVSAVGDMRGEGEGSRHTGFVERNGEILDDGGHAFGGFLLGMNENGSSAGFVWWWWWWWLTEGNQGEDPEIIVFGKAWKGEEVLDECFGCRSVVLRRRF